MIFERSLVVLPERLSIFFGKTLFEKLGLNKILFSLFIYLLFFYSNYNFLGNKRD